MNKVGEIYNKIKTDGFWNSLVTNSFWAFFGDSTASLINLAITIFLIKLIGNDNYGILVLAQSYMSIVDIILNVQCWKGVIQYSQKAIANKNLNALYEYINLGMLLDVITAIIGGIVSLLFVPIVGQFFNWSNDLIICSQILSLTIFSHLSGTSTAVLRILNKFNLVAFQKFISSLIKLLSFVFIYYYNSNINLITAVTIFCICDILGNIILIIFAGYEFSKKYSLRKLFKFYKISDKKDFIYYTFWGTLSDIVDIPVNYFDMFIISTIGVGYVSVYKVFKQVINIFQKVTSSIQQSIMPQFSELSALNQKRRGFNIVNKIRNVILIVGIPLALVLGFSSKYWLNLLYGNLYSENWWILLIYLLVQVIALSYSAIHPYFLSLDKSKKCALYVLFANTIYVLYAYVFIHKLGLLTMVISFAIQSSIVILLKIHDINRELKMGGD